MATVWVVGAATFATVCATGAGTFGAEAAGVDVAAAAAEGAELVTGGGAFATVWVAGAAAFATICTTGAVALATGAAGAEAGAAGTAGADAAGALVEGAAAFATGAAAWVTGAAACVTGAAAFATGAVAVETACPRFSPEAALAVPAPKISAATSSKTKPAKYPALPLALLNTPAKPCIRRCFPLQETTKPHQT